MHTLLAVELPPESVGQVGCDRGEKKQHRPETRVKGSPSGPLLGFGDIYSISSRLGHFQIVGCEAPPEKVSELGCWHEEVEVRVSVLTFSHQMRELGQDPFVRRLQ